MADGASQLTAIGGLPALVAGTGPPLVFLAGLFPKNGVTEWRRAHEASLAPYAGRRRVWYVNRRPGLEPGLTIESLAAEHAAGIRATFDGPVDVIGLSTGGSIAQQLAADHPDVVHRLALLCTGSRLGDDLRASMRRIAARIRGGAPRRALALSAATLLPGSPWALPAALAAMVVGGRALSDADLGDFATMIEAEDPFDLATCAHPIAAPTLLVAGDDDLGYPVALLRETATLIPDCSLRLIEGRGHLTVPGLPEVPRAILDHLDGLSSAPVRSPR